MFDYSPLIKSRALRIKILHLLDWVPDGLMLRVQYWLKTGRKLRLNRPQRYTEKLQWYKLYYKDPLMKQCVDKYEVRRYVEKCGFSNLLNECYGVFDRAEEVDFDKLPNQFVLKDTLGGGGNDVIVVKDKTKLDIPAVHKRMQAWVSAPSRWKHPGREWVYEGKKHRIVAEKYLSDSARGIGLTDYKFFCFNGKPLYCQVITERSIGEKIDFFDMCGTWQPFNGINPVGKPFPHSDRALGVPDTFSRMQQYARVLAQPFPFVRVDFYEADQRVVFGELTFYPASGYGDFTPDEFDFTLGKAFPLPDKRGQ